MTLVEIRQLFSTFTNARVAFRGGLRRLRPVVINRDAKQHIADLKATNEAYRRLPSTNHARDEEAVRAELLALRRNAAGVARHHTRGVREAAESLRTLVNEMRRDVNRSMPDALNGVTPSGMISLGLLRVATDQALANASAGKLFSTYEAALRRKDAVALVQAEVIEARVIEPGLASKLEDLPIARRLREYVDGVQEMREPNDLPDLSGLSREIDRLNVLADAVGVRPLDPEADREAAGAYEAEYEAIAADGAPEAIDDLAGVLAAGEGARA